MPTPKRAPFPGEPQQQYLSAFPIASDPTFLTTQALAREVANLKELIGIRLDGISVRLDGSDDATKLLQDQANRVPSIGVIEERVSALSKLIDEKFVSAMAQHDERFGSIQVQFKERDTRTEQTSRDAKTAVDAALQAAKEAVSESNKSAALAISKNEVSTIKSIDQIAALIQSIVKASDDKFSDIKDRIAVVEGRSGGPGTTIANVLSTVAIVVSIIAAVYSISHAFKWS